MEFRMKFHPMDVFGTAVTWIIGAISILTAQQIVSLCIGICALIAGIITIRNALLNGRKSALEIRHLERIEREEGVADA